MPDNALSRDAVVTRAVAIADAEGLEAVTIRRIAQEFGVTPMALYWHVENKDGLLAAMGDVLYAGIDLSGDPGAPWADRFRGLLESLLAAMRRHPALLPLAYERVIQCADGRNVTEYALALLREAGFSVRESANIAVHSLRTVVGLIIDEPGMEIGVDVATRAEHLQAKRAVIAALPAEQYPLLIDSVEDLIGCADQDGYDQLGLNLFIEGVQALARRVATPV
jgi:TetR/AcrR family tetracycline transcriptional repressor